MVAATKEQLTVAQASLTDALGEIEMEFQYYGEQVSFAEVASRLLEGADMTRELLNAGYIDENFTLYVTQFPGQGSAAAMVHLKVVQPNTMDIEYQFSVDDERNAEDIEAVLQSEGPRLLQGQSVYNIAAPSTTCWRQTLKSSTSRFDVSPPTPKQTSSSSRPT